MSRLDRFWSLHDFVYNYRASPLDIGSYVWIRLKLSSCLYYRKSYISRNKRPFRPASVDSSLPVTWYCVDSWGDRTLPPVKCHPLYLKPQSNAPSSQKPLYPGVHNYAIKEKCIQCQQLERLSQLCDNCSPVSAIYCKSAAKSGLCSFISVRVCAVFVVKCGKLAARVEILVPLDSFCYDVSNDICIMGVQLLGRFPRFYRCRQCICMFFLIDTTFFCGQTE